MFMVYAVEDGPAELHLLVRPLSAILGVVVGVLPSIIPIATILLPQSS